MPTAPLRPCTFPGCGELIASGSKCDKHKKEAAQADNRAKGSSWSRGYDAEWDRVRKKALKRDQYLCQRCLLEDDRMVPAEHVDHIKPFGGKKDPLRLDLKNLKSLCKPCHSRKTAKEDGGFGRPKKSTL